MKKLFESNLHIATMLFIGIVIATTALVSLKVLGVMALSWLICLAPLVVCLILFAVSVASYGIYHLFTIALLAVKPMPKIEF